jgi:hypothetical protein
MGILKKSLSRRKFLFKSLSVLFAGIIFKHKNAYAEHNFWPFISSGTNRHENLNSDKLDRYGGLSSIQFNASGFFRTHKADRWWFVTPEGSAFLSFGLNHPNSEYLLQNYNIDFWKKEFGFQDASEPSFREGFIKKVMTDLALFGMNTIGTHARKEEFGKLKVPYIQGLFFVNTSYWLNPKAQAFSDVFSIEFEQHCENVAQRLVEPRSNDPYLIGYTLTDCPVMTDLDAAEHGQDPWGGPSPEVPTWPRVLRNMGPDKPGKKVYVSLIRKRYSSIKKFNDVYKTQFSSFRDLLNSINWGSYYRNTEIDDITDNQIFLIEILEKYYSVSLAAIRKFDTSHLIFGDIVNAQTCPPDEIISKICEHTDLIAYQYYGDYDQQSTILNRWSKLTGKPLFHADSSFCVSYNEMPAPVGAICPDQEIRAQRFLDFANKAFSRPDFIGWNWCGWVDSWKEWKKVRQHSGLQDPFGRYHHPMPETMAGFGSKLYSCGTGEKVFKNEVL